MKKAGKYITIHCINNRYFENIIAYILEHFDIKQNGDAIFIISAELRNKSINYFRELYPGKRLIVYNWEQMMDGNRYLDVYTIIENMREADEIWDYDTLNADYLKMFGVIVDKIVPFKYTESIRVITNKDNPEIDVLIYGCMTEHRLDKLKMIYPDLYHEYSVVTTANLPIKTQYKYIANSKIILNLHGMHPYNRQEQERIAFCLINEKCVLSEPSQINYFGNAIIESDVSGIADRIKELLIGDQWKDMAKRGFETFKALRNDESEK